MQRGGPDCEAKEMLGSPTVAESCPPRVKTTGAQRPISDKLTPSLSHEPRARLAAEGHPLFQQSLPYPTAVTLPPAGGTCPLSQARKPGPGGLPCFMEAMWTDRGRMGNSETRPVRAEYSEDSTKYVQLMAHRPPRQHSVQPNTQS